MTVSLVTARSHKRWFPATAILCALVIVSPTTAAAAGAIEGNVLILMGRINDFVYFGKDFSLTFDIELQGDIESVTVSAPDGSQLELEGDDDFWWEEFQFDTYADLQQLAHGTWTITIVENGGASSTTTFTFNVNAIAESDIFATPSISTPAPGAVNVSPCPVVSWSDPTGPIEPDIVGIGVECEDHSDEQVAVNIMGTLSTENTSWQPPLPLQQGTNLIELYYFNFDQGTLGPLTVISGAVEWEDSPFAPEGYPSQTPLLVIGSLTLSSFHVSAATPCKVGDLTGNGAVGLFDLLTLLGAWGPCTNCSPGACPADLDGNCNVNVFDLLILIGAWG